MPRQFIQRVLRRRNHSTSEVKVHLKLYADSADTDAVTPLVRDGLIAGVTCNPTILDRDGKTSADIPSLYRELRGLGCREFFFQAVGRTARDLKEDASRILALGPDVVVKVPATWDGFSLAADLVRHENRVLITAVHTVGQVIMASAIGVEYVAPYYGIMLDKGVHADHVIEDMLQACQKSPTQLLVASVRTAGAVRQLVSLGVERLTIRPPVFRQLVKNDLTDRAVEKFDAQVDEWCARGVTW